MIKVHHLNESRSQRILWLLEELETPYEVVKYERDLQTRLAPSALKGVHPLGKSPVVEDGGVKIAESGAAIEYLAATQAQGRFSRQQGSPEWPAYIEWLHYAEGSAMLPLMLNMYVMRLGEAGGALHPRIDSEIKNHVAYVDQHLEGRSFFVGESLTGADVQMSFIAEVVKAFGRLKDYPNLEKWIEGMHARPAWSRALKTGGDYALGA